MGRSHFPSGERVALPPEPLNSDGEFRDNPTERCNLAFRFGVSQSDKLRGRDDFRDSLTNQACRINTPITLPGWDHIDSAAKILSAKQVAWSFGEIDHKDAYKSLPLRPGDSKYAVIALRDPTKGGWFGFRPKTQLFGPTAAVLHYNYLSRLMTSLACRLLLIPTVGYFDDFGFLVHATDASLAMSALTELFNTMGFILKVEKSAIGANITFLGLDARYPAPSNHMSLSLSIPADKSTKRARLIDVIISERRISATTLESLIGRLGIAQTAVFGRFAMAMLKPLYAKLYATRCNDNLPPPLRRNLACWRATLVNLRPRVITFDRSRPDWILYTDAAFEVGPWGGPHRCHISPLRGTPIPPCRGTSSDGPPWAGRGGFFRSNFHNLWP